MKFYLLIFTFCLLSACSHNQVNQNDTVGYASNTEASVNLTRYLESVARLNNAQLVTISLPDTTSPTVITALKKTYLQQWLLPIKVNTHKALSIDNVDVTAFTRYKPNFCRFSRGAEQLSAMHCANRRNQFIAKHNKDAWHKGLDLITKDSSLEIGAYMRLMNSSVRVEAEFTINNLSGQVGG